MSGVAWRIGAWLVLGCAAVGWIFPSSVLLRPASAADIALPELSNEARVYLKRVDALLAGGQPVEALDNLRRVIDTSGGDLIEVASPHATFGFRCFLPLRAGCQIRLVQSRDTAPEMLQIYRRQVDGTALRWLTEALEKNDQRRLREIVDQYFCSSAGDDALFWLGEYAFQRGEYASAREYWERIHPSFRWSSGAVPLSRYTGLPNWLLLRDVNLEQNWEAAAEALTGKTTAGRWLAYPDTDLDLTMVRARLVLTSMMQGDAEKAAIELEIFQRLAPAATGRLGGAQGDLAERLQQLLRESGGWPRLKHSSDWPTFAGSRDRGRISAADVDVGGGPIWSLPLARQSWLSPAGRADRLRVAEDADGLLSYHPVVVGDQVVLGTDAASMDVRSIDLRTGRVRFRTEQTPAPAATYSNRQSRAVPRFTLTASQERAYHCLRESEDETSTSQSLPRRSRMVAVDLAAEGRLAFEVRLEQPVWQGAWSFAGAPLSDDAYVYVALRRDDAFRNESHLACFDARDGSLCWRQFICASQALDGEEFPNNLLTLVEGVLYFNTNAGSVAAVSADEGAIRWVSTYPRATGDAAAQTERASPFRFRDLNPCLVREGLVYVAAADCERVFALDSATGQLVWTTRAGIGSDVIHLLGVGQGHLLGSGDGLYWFDAYNGRLKTQVGGGFLPAAGHARSDPRGHGRGLLANKNVYWPTGDSIFVFEQRTIRTETGWEPVLVREIDLASRGVAGGNLVMADSVLLIASDDQLYAFNETGISTHAAD